MTFAEQIEAEHKRIIAQRDAVVKDSAMDLYSSVVEASPVDTAELKTSWQLPEQITEGWKVSNIAPHAYIIDGGRRLDADGVMRGSEDLPYGYAPIVKNVEASLNKKLKAIR